MELYCDDCLNVLKKMPDKSVDLIVTDPPYDVCTGVGGKGTFQKEVRSVSKSLLENEIADGFDVAILDELMRVMKKPNIYIWCNGRQIPMYIEFFVLKHGCKMEIIIWEKPNALPTYCNKYIQDKEYCLYFRKGGYCNPQNYEAAKTVYSIPLNITDKRQWEHPTIKPLYIIRNLVENSSKEGDVVLDCFMGSGTTGVACEALNREFIGIEINKKWFDIAKERIEQEKAQLRLF